MSFQCDVRRARLALAFSASMLAALAQAQSTVSSLSPAGALKAQSVAEAKATARTASDLNPNALGDFFRDNVYTAVTPCRIVDTRVAGGPLSAYTSRVFDVDGISPTNINYSPQGGFAGSCGIPYGTVSSVAMTLTVTNAASPGNLVAWGLGTRPNSSVLNFSAGQNIANTTIVPVIPGAGGDFTVYTTSRTDVVIDVVGYFAAPTVTPGIAALAGAWTVTVSGFTGCGAAALHLPVTLNGAGTGTGLLTTHAACGNAVVANQTFAIYTLNADGSGTGVLADGAGGGYSLRIQVSPDQQVMNLIDVDAGNPGNYIAGTAVRHSYVGDLIDSSSTTVRH